MENSDTAKEATATEGTPRKRKKKAYAKPSITAHGKIALVTGQGT